MTTATAGQLLEALQLLATLKAMKHDNHDPEPYKAALANAERNATALLRAFGGFT